jgi:hypothetical protein
VRCVEGFTGRRDQALKDGEHGSRLRWHLAATGGAAYHPGGYFPIGAIDLLYICVGDKLVKLCTYAI